MTLRLFHIKIYKDPYNFLRLKLDNLKHIYFKNTIFMLSKNLVHDREIYIICMINKQPQED